eukprot:TRINITY_DN3225_c0_g2_i7.p1 TRINITY_DN3225_c0_g2~~TRINITY_DN3225_c0_g2_i7.p1  ORF type:complete len:671 (+),score=285.20 TRINITY_DN3225_c0_g2_i7:225-2237(+)
MAAILSPMLPSARPSTAQFNTPVKKDIIAGKISSGPTHNELLAQKLCDRCLNDEFSRAKCKDEAERLAKEQEEHGKYLARLRKEEEQLRKEKSELLKKQREEMTEFVSSKAAAKRKDSDPDINKEFNERFSQMQREAEVKKSAEMKQYRDQLKQQMEDKQNADKAAKRRNNEAAFTSLNMSGSSPTKGKIDPEEYRRVLQSQIHEKQRKRSNPNDRAVQSQLDKLSAELASERLKAELEKRKALKDTCAIVAQEKERKAKEEQREKMKDLEDIKRQKERAQQQEQVQKMRDLEKRKELNDYLINQIKERTNKRRASNPDISEVPIEERDMRPNKDNTVAMENLKLIQDRAQNRAMEREKERKADEEYLRQQKQLEEQEHLAAAKKKADQRNFFLGADPEKSKKDKELQDKLAKQQELDYYESLNNKMKEMIAKESEQQKAKLDEYKNVLDSQIAGHEAAKRLKHEQDMKDRLCTGLEFNGYQNSPHYDKQKYREDLKQQWKDEQTRKAMESREMPEDVAKMKELEEKYNHERIKDELAKKSEMVNEYKKAIELKNKQREDARMKTLDEQKQLEEARKLNDKQEQQRSIESGQRKKEFRNALKTQAEEDRRRKLQEKSERNQWLDDEARKRVRELERKMTSLREEIERCIKCNNPLDKKFSAHGKRDGMKF